MTMQNIPEIEQCIQNKKDLQRNLLDFLSSSDNDEENYQNLIQLFNNQNIHQNMHELVEFLHLLVHIANNHNRSPNFISKIEKILSELKSDIKQSFSNMAIFNIFKSNKRLLLYLFDEKIIVPNSIIADIMQTSKYERKNYPSYFYPEIMKFINEKEKSKYESMGLNALMLHMSLAKMNKEKKGDDQPNVSELYNKDPEDFLRKRKIGENTDDEIYNLIRNDDIDNFISHVNKINYNLKSKVKKSIFETNCYLVNKTPNLIEYASFFGSIQIFKYLAYNGLDLTSSIWMYAIHGDHPEIFQILEEKKIQPQSYEKCKEEAIKCHHNDIANYISSIITSQGQIEGQNKDGENDEDDENEVNLYLKNNGFYWFESDVENNRCQNILKYFNFLFIDFSIETKKCICLLCKYDYPSLFEILLKQKKIEVNAKVKNTTKKVKFIDHNKKGRKWWFHGRFYDSKIVRFFFIEEEKSYLNISIENFSIGVTQLLLSDTSIDVNSISKENVWWHTDFEIEDDEDVKAKYESQDEWWKDETSETETENEEKKEKVIEMTPLNSAIINHDEQTVQILLKRVEIDLNLRSVFKKWKWTSDEDRRYGREITDEQEKTPLFNAVEVGNIEIVRLLIEQNEVDVNLYSVIKKSTISTDKHVWKDWSRYEYQKTPLHEACDKINYEIVKLLLAKNDLEINKKFITNSYGVNYESDHDNDVYQINKWKINEKWDEIEDDYKNERKEKYDRSQYSTSKKVNEKTALDLAVRKKNQEIIDILKKNNAIEINVQSEKERENEEMDNLAIENMQECNIF